MKVTEQQVAAYLKCPVGTFEVDPFWECMLSETKAILRLAAEMKLLELKAIRDRLSAAWELKASQLNVLPAFQPIKGHRVIPALAHRLVSLIRDYKVLVPPMSVDLGLESGLMGVDYAVAVAWRTDDPLFCLNLVRSRPAGCSQFPDIPSLARWLHLQSRERYRTIQILNVPLLMGQAWTTSGLSKPLVRQQLNAMLNTLQLGAQFARPGSHCESCTTQRCKELTYER